jgi:hypothetical protein
MEICVIYSVRRNAEDKMMKPSTIEVEARIETECPSCHKTGTFQHIGTQKWPEAVAKKLNLPTVIEVYCCEHCHTSMTQVQLQEEKS